MKRRRKSRDVAYGLEIDEDQQFELDSFWPERTGLKQKLWFCGPAARRDGRPCGGVRVGNLFYPFSIDKPVEWLIKPAPGVSAADFSRIAEYVWLNREALLAYWNTGIYTSNFVIRLQKLKD